MKQYMSGRACKDFVLSLFPLFFWLFIFSLQCFGGGGDFL